MTQVPGIHPVQRRPADRGQWTQITQRRFVATRVDGEDFAGHVGLLLIDAISEPLVGPRSGLLLADVGFAWMTQLADGAFHTVTTMYDAPGNVIQWYIDICRAHSVDDAGMPWFDDLYLDISIYPNGRVVLLGEDELDAALAAGHITSEEHALAWREARTILAAPEQKTLDPDVLARRSAAHRELLLSLTVGDGRGSDPTSAG
jgi:predicted RNA-binding protein associated with RNAse of E/G family